MTIYVWEHFVMRLKDESPTTILGDYFGIAMYYGVYCMSLKFWCFVKFSESLMVESKNPMIYRVSHPV